MQLRDSLLCLPANSLDQATKTIRVVLAEPHRMFREALCSLLTLEQDIEVAGEAADGRTVGRILKGTQPDILILDLHMLRSDGAATLQVLKDAKRKVKLIVLTTHPDKREFMAAMKLGCQGIVLKERATELIASSIRSVFRGDISVDSDALSAVVRQIAASVMDGLKKSPLTQLEREIFNAVAMGCNNKEIAQMISSSERSVKKYLHSIFQKTGVSDRLELALCAVYEELHPVNGRITRSDSAQTMTTIVKSPEAEENLQPV
jgi:two-component system, NarL family, nitrate/nitrite response regulator NarL